MLERVPEVDGGIILVHRRGLFEKGPIAFAQLRPVSRLRVVPEGVHQHRLAGEPPGHGADKGRPGRLVRLLDPGDTEGESLNTDEVTGFRRLQRPQGAPVDEIGLGQAQRNRHGGVDVPQRLRQGEQPISGCLCARRDDGEGRHVPEVPGRDD
ncbi:hypothetical protein ACFL4G_12935, partial [Thermodesulfobacteriota bacterium]